LNVCIGTESVYKEIIGVSTHKGKEKEEGSEGVLNDRFALFKSFDIVLVVALLLFVPCSASQHEKGDSQDDSEDAMEVRIIGDIYRSSVDLG